MTHRLFASALLFAAGGLLAAAQPPASALPDDKKPAEKPAATGLEGTYTVVSGEKDGKAVPEERVKGSVVRFMPGKVVGTDKDKKEFFAADYTLDTTKTPWTIKMKSTSPKEAEAVGLIKKDGDTVTLVYGAPGGDTPKEFKTKENQHLFVLKAVKADAKDKEPAKP